MWAAHLSPVLHAYFTAPSPPTPSHLYPKTSVSTMRRILPGGTHTSKLGASLESFDTNNPFLFYSFGSFDRYFADTVTLAVPCFQCNSGAAFPKCFEQCCSSKKLLSHSPPFPFTIYWMVNGKHSYLFLIYGLTFEDFISSYQIALNDLT